MKLPTETDGKTVTLAETQPARIVARLDCIEILRDVYGQVAAQEIVATVEQRILRLASEGVRVRRIGDGMYAAALETSEGEAPERIINLLQMAVGDHLIETDAGPVAATLSVGAVVGPDARSLNLLRQASAAAVSASQKTIDGRCVEVAGCSHRNDAVATARKTLKALREDRFALAYQPVLRADRSDIVAFNECLARVLEPSGTIVAAGDFVPAMEELRLTRPLDRRVLELALEELRANPTLRLSVNLSAQSLCDPGWLRILAKSEAATPGLASRLIVEITESAIVTDEQRAYGFIAEVRRFGAAIALDDFGAGFSAFRHLKHLRPDILKIDGTFVEGVNGDPANRAMIESIMVVARHFEMMTVGEKVNDPQDAITLRRIGVDCFQGNSYGQPTIEPDWRAVEWGGQAAV